MLSSKIFLEKCAKLYERGVFPEYEVGDRIARGYADLGYEEFCVLGGGKIVSLFTGERSDFSLEHKRHFFRVPSFEEIVEELSKRMFDVVSIEFRDQRVWMLKVKKAGENEMRLFEHEELVCACLEALLGCVGEE